MLGVRLPEELERRLCELSQKTHRPKSFYVKEALEVYLNEYEKIYQAVADYEKAQREGTLVLRDLKAVMQDLKIEEKDLASEVL